MATAPPAFSVYSLRVTLQDTKPAIWRDILVPSNLSLENLHYVLQTVMGWGNRHLHQFIADHVLYSSDMTDDLGIEQYEARSETLYTIAQLLPEENSSILYEYDFADSWTHTIELKKILPASKDIDADKPRCTRGKRACPPEDCGGVWGYTDMLETLKAEGGQFDPEYFDIDSVNQALNRFLIPNTPKQTL